MKGRKKETPISFFAEEEEKEGKATMRFIPYPVLDSAEGG